MILFQTFYFVNPQDSSKGYENRFLDVKTCWISNRFRSISNRSVYINFKQVFLDQFQTGRFRSISKSLSSWILRVLDWIYFKLVFLEIYYTLCVSDTSTLYFRIMELPGLKQGTTWENDSTLLEWQTWTGVGKKGIGSKTQCGIFWFFLLLRFYVKSILAILDFQKLSFSVDFWCSEFWFSMNFCAFRSLNLPNNTIQSPLKCNKWSFHNF